MRQLLQGIREFQSTYFSENRHLFEQLAHGQTPKVLLITCSDSRIDPNLITQTDPGDLFVIRNAGNIIPPFGAANGGEGAAIEYAVTALDVQQIIICGHSHCGAMKGLFKIRELQSKMPLVCEWLNHAAGTLKLMQDNYSHLEGEELLEATIAENVLTQIENLKTYPVIRSGLHGGTIAIYAWVYQIETGEVLAYNPDTHSFELAEQDNLIPSYCRMDGGPDACATVPSVKTKHSGNAAMASQAAAKSAANSAAKGSVPKVQSPVQSKPVTNGDHGYAIPDAPSWLAADQADRIYRGGKR
jgi:carbonic anhydrase